MTCGEVDDNEHLSVLKQSIRLRFAVALWKINSRTMLDAAKMLSAGEVLEDVSGNTEGGRGGSLIGDGLEWERPLDRGQFDVGW